MPKNSVYRTIDRIFERVKGWVRWAMRFFKLKGFIILKSSENCYHVIFDRKVSWSENLSITGRIVLMTHHSLLKKWFLIDRADAMLVGQVAVGPPHSIRIDIHPEPPP